MHENPELSSAFFACSAFSPISLETCSAVERWELCFPLKSCVGVKMLGTLSFCNSSSSADIAFTSNHSFHGRPTRLSAGSMVNTSPVTARMRRIPPDESRMALYASQVNPAGAHKMIYTAVFPERSWLRTVSRSAKTALCLSDFSFLSVITLISSSMNSRKLLRSSSNAFPTPGSFDAETGSSLCWEHFPVSPSSRAGKYPFHSLGLPVSLLAAVPEPVHALLSLSFVILFTSSAVRIRSSFAL
mmetsp:Transcript_66204/g.137955  ORF Transcript_66204/g.137955 Transcript_66204/m.137955 type:complete len:244 (-) Transcript_66204:533-1264(-)